MTISSEDYKLAKKFVLQDRQISAVIGNVKQVDFKIWDGFESVGGNGGYANYSFNAISDKGKFVVEIHLIYLHDEWNVKEMDVRAPAEMATHIVIN